MKDGMSRVTFDLESEVRQKLKIACAKDGRAICEVLRDLVMEYIKKKRTKA